MPNVIVFVLPAGSTELMINKHAMLSLLTIIMYRAIIVCYIYLSNIRTFPIYLLHLWNSVQSSSPWWMSYQLKTSQHQAQDSFKEIHAQQNKISPL